MRPSFATVLESVRSASQSGWALRQFAMEQLGHLPGYDWCGVYILRGDALVLEAYVGEETEHTRIAVGVGVCGTAIREDRNRVIEDVREESNYLSCSHQTRSEIVVLIRGDDGVLGQIDVDGHEVGAFTVEDEAFLGELASILAERWM